MKFDLDLIQQDIDKELEKEKQKQLRKRTMKNRRNRHASIATFKELKGLFNDQIRETD